MTTEEKIDQSETHVFKVVFPDTTNHHNTMFGGRILMMMTETAFMTATRFCRKSFVLVSSGQIDFKKPIPAGSMVELVGRVERIGNTSITIQVEVYLEKMREEFREKVVSGAFTLVAIDEDNKPVLIR
ncbi:acyl-CoA hydrolase [Pedobacter cryoconitis]|uniref:Acyl-CoA hydrolase n=1 Tax=Pedobacter cryoconitis TaxID=188932 RepID=A0A7W8YW66_9SPHI|nr:acyl-CoA thioesterase [Pedobacter cryoconitis]MBB5622904.1 acyl-CoA hydrolase [Pedobacter cryoconitis]MBB5645045.1 acyl-CoA hydrolase [Pedobacter cryoconitis]